ncbi:MAG: hypothetical protein MZW92_36940 [Comamonadaceae bacterium]|nr:hypothetical protein [Comamonadaceae bacterium]
MLGEYPVGDGSAAVAWDGRHIWVTAEAESALLQIDPVSGGVLRAYRTGSGPASVLAEGSRVWVANGGADSIGSIRPDVTVQ